MSVKDGIARTFVYVRAKPYNKTKTKKDEGVL
jgi:hypothetical protein